MSRSFFVLFAAAAGALLSVQVVAQAATTISTNIHTDGTLSVGGAGTFIYSNGIGTTTMTGGSILLNRGTLELRNQAAQGIDMYVNNNNANGAPFINMYKSRGTYAIPSTVLWCGSYECGDYTGGINFGGYDGASYGVGSAIYSSVDEDWTPTSHEGHLSIYFTKHGQTTQDEIVQFGGKDPSNINGTNVLFYWPVNFYTNSATGVHLVADQQGGLDMTRGDGSAGAVLSVMSSVLIGTTTSPSPLHVSKGANATTTITMGELGLTSSKACVNMNRSDGGPVSFYFNAAGVMIVETNYCR